MSTEVAATKAGWAAVSRSFDKDYKPIALLEKSLAGYKTDQGVQKCVLCSHFDGSVCGIVEQASDPLASCDVWTVANVPETALETMSMYITRALIDESTHQRIWAASTSDTGFDKYDTRMSKSLFKDFVKRIKEGEPAPKQFQSTFWKGGMPYLSIAHYPDLNGFGHVGIADEVRIDGDFLKSKGLWGNDTNPSLAETAFRSVVRDIQNKVPFDKRIRVSISFIDWEHQHADGSVFTRRSLYERCSYCAEYTQKGTTFLKGQLVHFALTRVPANERTAIIAVERSMTTQKDDAVSIVGEEEASKLEARAKEAFVSKSEAVVNKSEVDDLALKERYGLGGATTLADAIIFNEAQDMACRISDMSYMLQRVVDNILEADPSSIPDKAAAIKAVITDFAVRMKQGLEEKSMTTQTPAPATPEPSTTLMTPTPPPVAPASVVPAIPPHPLDAVLNHVRSTYDAVLADKVLGRTAKQEAFGEALKQLSAVVSNNIATTTPLNESDAQAIANRAATEAVQRLLESLGPKQPPQNAPTTIQRSLRQPTTPPAAVPDSPPAPAPTQSYITAIARRSVGLTN